MGRTDRTLDPDDDYHIEISPRTDTPQDAVPRLEDAIRLTLRQHRRVRCRISLAIVDDARMAELHQQYLGKSGPTDCLSFDLRDEPDSDVVEGEIVVSLDTARREAGARNVSEQAELVLYAVHALLHLLGYEDAEPQSADRMHRMENQLLTELGYGPVFGAQPI